MTTSEKLAQSLEQLRALQDNSGLVIIKSSQLSRTHLSRLVSNGFLQEVLKGWYVSSRPDSLPGDTTAWYTGFWSFAVTYATDKFGDQWSLSPDQSLALHTGNRIVPGQLIIRSPKANNQVVNLLHDTSFLLLRAEPAKDAIKEPQFGLRLYSLAEAVVYSSPGAYLHDALDMRTGLSMIKDSSDVLRYLAEHGMSLRAGRIAGAFRNIGRDSFANEIVSTMKRLDHDVREEDPFDIKIELPRAQSPYVTRLQLMWQNMRDAVVELFPDAPASSDIETFIATVEAQYKLDAYHSLSIEGYRVTEELIEKVRSGDWKPDLNESDKEQRNALAARGYWQAFQEVKKSVRRVLEGENAGSVAEMDHRTWYRELFQPCVAAGIVKTTDLAGYRSAQVYIRGSLHTPLSVDAVRDAMPELFRLIATEPHAGVRAVLGHFLFTFIHPYMDGNGRIGRFLMNVMLASGGYNWIIIPVERRNEYMAALEKASVHSDITDFIRFVVSLMKQ